MERGRASGAAIGLREIVLVAIRPSAYFAPCIDDAGELRIAAAAGVWSAAITGLILAQDALGTMRAILEDGLSALGCESLEIVPADILQQEAVADRKRSRLSLVDPLLFQMVAQHTGLALGMLRALAQRDAVIGELQFAAAVFDKSFVDGIADDPNDAAIVIAIPQHGTGCHRGRRGDRGTARLSQAALLQRGAGFPAGSPDASEQIGKLIAIPDWRHKEK